MEEITILGSTGSIGVQALNVLRTLLPKRKVKALTANQNVGLLEQQVREFRPEYICIGRHILYEDLKARLADIDVKILVGEAGLCEIASLKCDLVINALVGMIGLKPTLAAINAKNKLALANKETLVVGGKLVIEAAKRNKVDIIPVDSEHSAIFQCLMGNTGNKIKNIILTASGGPFFGYSTDELRSVTKAMALNHPNWTMGAKITIDSATLVNKGLELIEAMWLFNVTPEQIQPIIHRQSVIHSAVEYEDGAVIAQLGVPDMQLPIQFALTYPKRTISLAKPLSLLEVNTLTFKKIDEDVFTAFSVVKAAASIGGNVPCIVNAANEAAVSLFLDDKIPFFRISELISEAFNTVRRTENLTLDIIEETESTTRDYVLSHFGDS